MLFLGQVAGCWSDNVSWYVSITIPNIHYNIILSSSFLSDLAHNIELVEISDKTVACHAKDLIRRPGVGWVTGDRKEQVVVDTGHSY